MSRKKQRGGGRTSRASVAARNRRRPHLLRGLLIAACGVLAVEVGAVMLYSPRFRVRQTRVEGNRTVTTQRLLERLAIGNEENLFRMAVGARERAVEQEPAIARASVFRVPPDQVRLVVEERVPYASVRTPDGAFYTVDATLVPFRQGRHPEPGLPCIRLEAPIPVALGRRLTFEGAGAVHQGLSWAAGHPEFSLESIVVDAHGKLCLNRVGGLPVHLGTDIDLDRKLETLSRLLIDRPGLRRSADIANVNLFAWDAPALMPRFAPPEPKP